MFHSNVNLISIYISSSSSSSLLATNEHGSDEDLMTRYLRSREEETSQDWCVNPAKSIQTDKRYSINLARIRLKLTILRPLTYGHIVARSG